MKHKLLTIPTILIILVTIFISGCTVAQAMMLDDSEATSEGVKAVVNSNNQFTSDLYSKLLETEEGNIFFSPYSITSAFAMTYEGARGTTAEEIKQVFYFPDEEIVLRSSYARLFNLINKPDKSYQLSTANALWAQEDYPFLEEYLSIIENYYGGETTNLDIEGDIEGSRQTINKWVEDQTYNKIKDLIPKGILKPTTRLVLTNAIYFKGTWLNQFDPKNTREMNFYVSDTETVTANMMYLVPKENKFNYAETDNLQLLELPYEGEEISMMVILPKTGKMPLVESNFTSDNLELWKNSMTDQKVTIYLPKFKFKTNYFMVPTFKDMGMVSAFRAPPADFSGLDGTKTLKIQEIIHQAFVEVNEEGTEAAAATAVVIGKESASINPIFKADRPFIFIIQEKSTGAILFLGKVMDPTVE
ncbi:proteinase IV [archaeon]|nr:proteinase IV [archaeon]